ncbi:hypothetical protein RM697_09035 [Ichthyenterobacterium sp. W332]|uniref:Uncharacterized protein n=1 Tax=Microcosmobacter mediterraneus TaxID=3075607 RepID=A0ABU2YLK6_9FLAO|nr:hypothetical protein [Ichthyenterobacterium sp. W332]MDT0558791.1 hypothetical protein [Ichthyenterobacterium sp. W332]
MDKYTNLKLHSSKPISTAFRALGKYTFTDACNYLQHLYYQRISDRNNYNLVLSEHCGTCSSKHALLKALAIENKFSSFNLCIGIYKMNSLNTKGIGTVLNDYNLQYIPEAHTYLKDGDSILDITGLGESNQRFSKSLLYEESISPEDVGDYKVNLHKTFIKEWIHSNAIPYTFDVIWNLREQCIANLSA